MWLGSKYRALAEDLATQLTEIRLELEAERAKRISAEAIASDRGDQIEQLYLMLTKANDSRDAAVADRLKSLDLVNLALLNQHGPEKPPPDIKQFHAVPGQPNAVAQMRKADRTFMKDILKRQAAPRPAPTEPTPVQ